MRLLQTERAVSTTLTYVLTLTIVTLLISGLFVSTSSFVDGQRERAIRSEFAVIGNRIAANLATADRLARTIDGSGHVSISESLPSSVASSTYRVNVSSDPSGPPYDVTLELTSTDPRVTVSVSVRTRTDVVDASVVGGDVTVVVTASDMLEVRND